MFLSKLILKNFQTYKTATFNFADHLNFIAAPNGSGKSSITNAINFLCLGTAKTINKTCDLNQYIRFGEKTASVEGFFTKNEITTKIKREIMFNHSKYFINDKTSSKREVLEFLKKNCIDVNNMTQFLPQEKVSEFAKMSSNELFDEVLKTLDNDEINKQRKEIIEREKKLEELKSKIDNLSEIQLGNKKIVDSLQEEVLKYKERNLKLRRIDLLQLKVHYIDYNELLQNIRNESAKIDGLEESIKENKAAIKSICEQINSIENSEGNNTFKSNIKNFEARNVRLSDFVEEIEKRIQGIELLNIDILNLEKRRESRKKEIEVLKEKTKIYKEKLTKIVKINMTEVEKSLFEKLSSEIEKYKINSESMKNILSLDTAYENVKNHKSNFESYLSKIIDNLHEHKINIVKEEKVIQEKSLKSNLEYESLQKQKIEFGQTEQIKLNKLKTYNKNCYEGVCWLRKNQNMFKQEILEPAFLHVNVKDMRYINEIENCLSYNMLVTFICQNEHDFSTFTKVVKDDLKLSVNVMMLSEFHEIIDSNRIKQLGFDGTVLDFIETRKEYVKLFCILGNIHKIPICKKKIDDTGLFDKFEYKKVIINERYLEVKRSRYDKKDFTMIDSGLRRKNIFGNESIKNEIDQIEKKITEIKLSREECNKKVRSIFTQKQIVEEALNKFYNLKSEYRVKHSEMTEYNMLQTKLTKYIQENNEKITDYLDNSTIQNDIDVIRQKIETKGADIQEFISKSQFKTDNVEFFEFYKEICILQHLLEQNLQRLMDLREQKRTCDQLIISNQTLINTIMGSINEFKGKRDSIKEIIKNKIEKLQNSEPGSTTTTKIYSELERLNPNRSKLEEEIIALKTDINFITIDNVAIKDYKARQYNLQNIDKEQKRVEEEYERFNKQNLGERDILADAINKFVVLIDSRFGYFFKKINSEGKVIFVYENIKCDKWELCIFVKFRKDEELSKLTSFRQSGGEKSVSTVLFLLALQNLSKSPFKLVDEINQGMDRNNEKMINDLLIELCEEEGAPQFFLLTPKIVQDIRFSKKVKVFVIYNNVNEETRAAGFSSYQKLQ